VNESYIITLDDGGALYRLALAMTWAHYLYGPIYYGQEPCWNRLLPERCP
jgi:hypothetical protein